MRLIRLRVKNIASLKGEHEVPFSDIQSYSSLFAITGETGAGKSSLLNALGLALYGQIYKKNVTQIDVVTLGEKEGQIELIFQVKGKTYLADWRAKVRKQNGEVLKQPQITRYIYPIEGMEFDSIKSSPIESIENLLNLDFDQFCKCIILNQGEFARFLMSSFTERKEILEKLYPGEMLESLSRELKMEVDVLQKQSNELDIELGTLKGDGVLGDDLKILREELSIELDIHKKWFTHFESLDYHFVSLHSYHGKFQETHKKIEGIQSELSTHTTIYNHTLKASEDISTTYQNAVKHQERELPRLQGFLKLEEVLKHQERSFNELKLKEQKIKHEQKELSDKLSHIHHSLSEWQTKRQELSKNFTSPTEDLIKAQLTLNRFFDLLNEKDLFQQNLKAKAEKLTILETQKKDLELKAKNLKAKKADLRPDAINHLAALEEKKKILSQEVEKKQKHDLKLQEITHQLGHLEKEILDLAQKKAQLLPMISQLKEEYAPIEVTLKLQELTLAVEVCLSHPSVEEKGECPVCQTHFEKARWQELRSSLEKTDQHKLKSRFEELSKQILKHEGELRLFSDRLSILYTQKESKSLELTGLKSVSFTLISLTDIEAEIQLIRKELWDHESILKEEKGLHEEELKVISLQKNLTEEWTLIQQQGLQKEQELSILMASLPNLLEPGMSSAQIAELKRESRQLPDYLKHESQGEKFLQEKTYLNENLKQLNLEQTNNTELINLTQNKINDLKLTLTPGLG